MRPAQRPAVLLAAAAAAALSLGGCAAVASAGDSGPATGPAVQAPTGSAPASDAPGAAPSAEATTPAAPPSPASPSAAPASGLATFTFPDGRLSFAYPADWKVEVFEPSQSPYSGTATVYDAAGKDVINVYYGQIADVVASSAGRFVLEVDPVPGLVGQSVPTPHSSFFVDRSGDAAQYRMRLTAGLPVSPNGQVQEGLVKLGDRILTADVLFSGAPFADDNAAKAWYWGDEGRALKAVLMSLSYR